jgi:ribosomal protein L28
LEVTPGKFQNVKVSSKTIKTLKKQGKLVNKFAKKSTATPTNL